MIKIITKNLITSANEFRSKKFASISKYKPKNPPVFQSQGDKSLDEYWQKRACAVACLLMVLKTVNQKKYDLSLKKLMLVVLANGGYDIKTDTGWYHSSLVNTANNFNLIARSHKYVGFYSQSKLVKEGNFVLSSLHSPQGGHMILIYGTDVSSDNEIGFIYNDPSMVSGGKNKFISKRQFNKISKNQAISIKHV